MEDFLRLLRSLEKSSIRLNISGPAAAGTAATRFGGAPDVPVDFQWPVFTTATFDDDEVLPRPLCFLAQFNCAELAPLDKEHLLPDTGLLSFFYELGSQRWGFDPADAGCARCSGSRIPPPCPRRSFPTICPGSTAFPPWASP